MDKKIEFIDASKTNITYLSADILQLLETQEIGLSYGTEFMGKPGTKLYSQAVFNGALYRQIA
jgi:hypothetical protein